MTESMFLLSCLHTNFLFRISKMQLLKNITALGLLLATTAVKAAPVASPVDSSVNEASPSVLFIEKRDASIGYCGKSTFENRTSGGSPRVDDCLQIARNIAGGGTWTVPGDTQHQLVQYGTCAFGTQHDWKFGGGTGPIYKVGNEDIIDLINDSVNRFQWNGLVGAKGSMVCKGYPDAPIEWGLYHN
jgi:hypothetical protein